VIRFWIARVSEDTLGKDALVAASLLVQVGPNLPPVLLLGWSSSQVSDVMLRHGHKQGESRCYEDGLDVTFLTWGGGP
jgi:hypothetical protein